MKQDPTRLGWFGTGIYVRAISVNGRYTNIDIGELDKESLKIWLADKPRDYLLDIIGILMGHGHLREKHQHLVSYDV